MVQSGITGEVGVGRGPDSSVGVEQLRLKWNETLIGKALDFDDVTLAAGSTVNIFSFGDSTAKEVTITDYWLPFRMNIASIANPSAARLASLMFLKFATTTADQANLDIQGIGLTVDIGKDVGYVHALEVLLDISETSTVTGECMAGKFRINLTAAKTLTAHTAAVLQAIVSGAGASVGTGGPRLSCLMCRVDNGSTVDSVIDIVNVTGCTITNAIKIGAGGAITYVFNFGWKDGTSGAKVGAACNSDGVDSDGAIKIYVNDTIYYIPFYTAGNTANSW